MSHAFKHHPVSGLWPEEVCVDVVRLYEFDQNGRLILAPIHEPTYRLTWERIQ